MPKDYKDRANQSKKYPSLRPKVIWWKWGVIIFLIALFIVFLIFIQNTTAIDGQVKSSVNKLTVSKKGKLENKNKNKVEPRFDFYTILPKADIVISNDEISTRSREEHFGKENKSIKYLMQAGSFKQFPEADKLRARLALMGIESRVEKATVGGTIWNRVKIGPYVNPSSVSIIKKRLKKNGIAIIVTEIKG